MSKLMTIDEYLATAFSAGSIPTKRTALDWIRRGDLLAHKIGRKYYVDMSNGDPLLTTSNDSLLNKILGDLGDEKTSIKRK
jgi:hypothetical protein